MLRTVVIGALVAATAADGAVMAGPPGPDAGGLRTAGLAPWPGGCTLVTTSETVGDGLARRWRHASQTARIRCDSIGPALAWARFPTRGDLLADLDAAPTPWRVCVA